MSRFINVQHGYRGSEEYYRAFYESWSHDCVRVFEWSSQMHDWFHVEDLPRPVFNDNPEVDDGVEYAVIQAEEDE